MTLPNRSHLLLFVLLASCGHGDGSSMPRANDICAGISLADKSLALQTCDSSKGVVFAKYKGTHPDSPYATEFDERKVIVAASENTTALLTASGFELSPSTLTFIGTKLDVIPSLEQVSSRELSTPITHNGWTVNREDIQYFEPHGSGYVISCVTALKEQEKNYVVVSECVPYGQLSEFMELLRSFRAPSQ